MPLEINEIGIQMRVGAADRGTRAEQQDGTSQSKPCLPSQDSCGPDTDQIVQECVRRVLGILQDRQER